MEEFTVIEAGQEARDAHGHAWGSGVTYVAEVDIKALLAGKQWAIYDGEYVHFVEMETK